MTTRSAHDSTRVEAFASQLIRSQAMPLGTEPECCEAPGLLQALRQHGPATLAELATALGCAEDVLRTWLRIPRVARELLYETASQRFALKHEVATRLSPEGPDVDPRDQLDA
jgi:hypothetical protein